jgi:hypothetical protein
MKAEEKAKELIYKMHDTEHCGIKHIPNQRYCDCIAMNLFQAKQCALIAVDELIKSNPTNPLTGGYIELYSDMVDESIAFWQSVKTEIEKL